MTEAGRDESLREPHGSDEAIEGRRNPNTLDEARARATAEASRLKRKKSAITSIGIAAAAALTGVIIYIATTDSKKQFPAASQPTQETSKPYISSPDVNISSLSHTLEASINPSALDSLVIKESDEKNPLGYWTAQNQERKGFAFVPAGIHSFRLADGASLAPTLELKGKPYAYVIARENGKEYLAIVENPETRGANGLAEVTGLTYLAQTTQQTK